MILNVLKLFLIIFEFETRYFEIQSMIFVHYLLSVFELIVVDVVSLTIM